MSGEDNSPIARGGAKSAFILNSIALSFIVPEAMMGPTILGNIIFPGLARILALIGGLPGVTALASRRTKATIGALLVSAAIVAYIVVRFLVDNVPAGYGP